MSERCRAPRVVKEGGRYRMWMNARPALDEPFETLYSNIYEFWSDDGIVWTRRDRPAVQATGRTKTCVYPYVLKLGGTYYMWHIGHLKEPDGATVKADFEIFCDTSEDGSTWKLDHEVPAFAASRDPGRFDVRWVSTPCVVESGDLLRLYHAGCNLRSVNSNLFEGGDDGEGLHIALATCQRTGCEAPGAPPVAGPLVQLRIWR